MNKKQFPIFTKYPSLVYLDNAATTQKPNTVIDAITKFYTESNANVHRGIHELSEKATTEYEAARKNVAEFINANSPKEVIFTYNTTDSINKLALSLEKGLSDKDTILISPMEHHSNLLPWQEVAKRTGAQLEYVNLTNELKIDLEDLQDKLKKNRVKLISLTFVSNVTGVRNDIEAIVEIARKYSTAIIHIDAAQAVAHIPIDVQALDIDAMSFSGHKMYGPTGIGVLWGRESLLGKIPPLAYGGGMIERVSRQTSTFAPIPEKHEAGTPNIGGAVGLSAAIDFLKSIGMEEVESNEKQLVEYGMKELGKIEDLTLFGPNDPKSRTGVFSFTLATIHPHDIAQILTQENVAVRSGHHCCQILHREILKVPATTRASIAAYNTKEDIDSLVMALEKTIDTFKSY